MIQVRDTPLVKLEKLSKELNRNIYGKIETGNPTGSHKDRESIEAVTEAVNKGYSGIGCASTGNAAISISAYAYAAGLKCHIYVSDSISPEKMALIQMFKPEIQIVKGDYDDAYDASCEGIEKHHLFSFNPGQCQAKLRGNAAIGREIAAKISPEYVVCPTNNGTHFTGVWMGLKEIAARSRMVAATTMSTRVADSISGYHRREGEAFQKALKESRAMIIDVSDEDIRRAVQALFREGIFPEPSAAASVAAVRHLKCSKDDVICCTVTGSALKFPRIVGELL